MHIHPNKGIGVPIKLFGLSGILCLLYYGSLLLTLVILFFLAGYNFLYALGISICLIPFLVFVYLKLKEFEKERGYSEFIRKLSNKNSIHKHRSY